MNLCTKKKQTHRHRKQAYDYRRREGGGERQIRGVGLTGTNKSYKVCSLTIWN